MSRAVERVYQSALGVVFAGILVAALAQVASRHIPGVSLIGAEEVARFMMIGTAFLAIPLLVFNRLQISVDALGHFLPTDWAKRLLRRVILVVETVFYVMFANYAYFVYADYTSTGQTTPSMSIPLSLPTLVMVIGAALGALACVAMFVSTFITKNRTHTNAAPAGEAI